MSGFHRCNANFCQRCSDRRMTIFLNSERRRTERWRRDIPDSSKPKNTTLTTLNHPKGN